VVDQAALHGLLRKVRDESHHHDRTEQQHLIVNPNVTLVAQALVQFTAVSPFS
jgi:hypothetical protein